MEAHDDQTVSNRAWRMVGCCLSLLSPPRRCWDFTRDPHSVQAPLVEGGKCDMRRCIWCRGSWAISATKKGKGGKTVEKTPSLTENERIQWQSKENGHASTQEQCIQSPKHGYFNQQHVCAMPVPSKISCQCLYKAGYSRAGKVRPFSLIFQTNYKFQGIFVDLSQGSLTQGGQSVAF